MGNNQDKPLKEHTSYSNRVPSRRETHTSSDVSLKNDNFNDMAVSGKKANRPSDIPFKSDDFTNMAVSGKRKRSSFLVVAAFDFGTTYSGYAMSFRDNPLNIITNQSWIAGSENLISLKTPTCVLLKPNKEFHSFGFEAENKYSDLSLDDEHHGWLLFRRFKMKLHNTEGLSRDTTVEDVNGNSMPAMTIISMSLRYLRDHFVESLEKKTQGVTETDVQYVITVPAIWDDRAKQFMREAAIMSGMESSRLLLALEPEAASIWCLVVTTLKVQILAGVGSKYIVVDLGGGTADISVHEKQPSGQLKELHKASGGPWGGSYVDNNYISCLTNIFGKATFDRFKREQMADFIDLHREFETKKRGMRFDTKGKITFKVSAAMMEIFKDIENHSLGDRIEDLGLSGKMSITGDKLRVDSSVVKSWFDGPVDSMICHVKDILSEPKMKDVKLMLLVGGFGESRYVQDRMVNEFGSNYVIIPEEAGLAVLKGAVRFGHTPDIMSARVMQYTYGIRILVPYDEFLHPPRKVKVVNGEKKAKDVFDNFVIVGSEIPVGYKVTKRKTPNDMNRTFIPVFRASSDAPYFTTDQGCTEIGFLVINHPEGKSLQDKVFDVTFTFGDTELFVEAKMLHSAREFSLTIDCLNKI